MDIKYSIWLAERPNCSPRFRCQLLELFGSAKAIWESDEQDYHAVLNLKKNQLESLLEKGMEHTERIISDCKKHGINIISIEDEQYPEPLRNLEDAPTVIYVKGTLPDWSNSLPIGIVGTRKATKYGLGASHWFGENLAKAGCIIVSGMAKGIDSYASRGALSVGGKTIAVFGCGLDICYPPSNKNLMNEIINNGAIISEYPPGSEPAARHFPERNRIMSGLSKGVLVIEAPAKSGALITANLALEQGKELFAVPGNINSPASMGTNQLIKDCAELVTCAEEILTKFPDELKLLNPIKPYRKKYITEDKQNIPNTDIKPEKREKFNGIQLTPEEQLILNAVKNGADNIEAVCVGTGLAVQNVLASLTMLEINGVLKRSGASIMLTQE